MDLQQAFETRQSIRTYKDKPVEREKLEQIVEIGRTSHSAKNLQPWHFVIVDDKEVIEELNAGITYKKNQDGPAYIITFGKRDARKMDNGLVSAEVDTSIATSYMQLKATELGLGTVWLGAFDAKKVEEVLNAPENLQAMHVTVIGYPDEEPERRPRKSLDEVMSYNKF